jgi:hypothetical protein
MTKAKKGRSSSAKKNVGNNKGPVRDNSDELDIINRVEKPAKRRRTGSPVGNLRQEKTEIHSLNNKNRNDENNDSSRKPNPRNKYRLDVGSDVRLGILNLLDPARLSVRLGCSVRRLDWLRH